MVSDRCLSYDGCLEERGNCSVLYCTILKLCKHIRTFARDARDILLRLTVVGILSTISVFLQ